MPNTLARPPKKQHNFRRVAILFAGGPAPAANAVISTAAVSFLRNDVEVLGIKHGYSNLMQFGPDRPMELGRDYIMLDHQALSRSRAQQGIMIGTARANPGKQVSHPDHLKDPERSAPLQTTYDALCSLGVDALISIGGDDTLKTANKFKLFQETLPEGSQKIPVVHLPKTIDNDYMGIDFTFGYFTAVDFLAGEVRNLLYDAEAGQAYFLVECMGRSAGWLPYGTAIAGEASLVISVEDIIGDYVGKEEEVDGRTKKVMNVDKVVDRIVKTMLAREAEGKKFGVIILAEGLAEMLPPEYLEGIKRDDHGHISITEVSLGRQFAKWISKRYEEQTGRSRKVTGLQLGYEARCSKPHAFDVMLGSQLGVGAYRALVEEGLNGVMVSVSGQLNLHYVAFENLVDPETLVTVVRYINPMSDFHRLARFLETYIND
ncbi:6-phosphofructokinase [Blastopirellula marina]|uniref:6-phosphofructokinase, pyrophosphate-dependent n=1 Tax=Blastopirellula marina DSM 3645 TaxID=314230 RepID=A3ZPW3_9BACT|nr:6-phosphofructokinase [Blastopirellula marina]EAQ81236.1 6-phosphofructokinase, pyrophosphate-dependent [Blastopirellula marina DSM 3645]